MRTNDPLYTTKLRLAGKAEGYSFIPDDNDESDPEESDQDTALLQAISNLNDSVQALGTRDATVDIRPILEGIGVISAQMATKKEYTHHVKYDSEDRVTEIISRQI